MPTDSTDRHGNKESVGEENNIDNIPRQSKAPQKAGGFFGDPALPAAAKDEKATLLKNKVAFFRGQPASGIWQPASGGWRPADGGWEPAFSGRLPASGGQRGIQRMGAGIGQPVDGSWDWAAGSRRLGTSVVAGG